MFMNIELARQVQRAKVKAAIACLQNSCGIHAISLSFLWKNPVTQQRYWQPPVASAEDGVLLVTISAEGSVIESMDDTGLHMTLPHDDVLVKVHLPYDYLFQIECFDLEGQIVYFDMLPVLLDADDESLQPSTPPAETKKSHLRLVHG